MVKENVSPPFKQFRCKKTARAYAVLAFYKKHRHHTFFSTTTASAPIIPKRTTLTKKKKLPTHKVRNASAFSKKYSAIITALTSFLTTRSTKLQRFLLALESKRKKVSLFFTTVTATKKSAFRRISSTIARKKKRTPQFERLQPIAQWFKKTIVYDYLSSFFIVLFKTPLQTVSVLFFFAGIVGGVSYLYIEIFKDLPEPKALTESPIPVSSKILDRNGTVLYRIYEDENRTIVPLEDIPLTLIQATIAIEDQDFYDHYGFSPRGILRAFVANQKQESVQGGSTLTQQLVKNRLLTPERTFKRKIKELILAILVENTYSKNQILEMYLNQAPYGGSTYGIEEASQKFFGKSVSDLTLEESALLAGLPAAPTIFSPYGSNPELAKTRQIEVLRRMAEENFITFEEANAAAKKELVLARNAIDIEAPHFVMYIRSLLAERYGEEALLNGGLIVKTTLDLPTQKSAQNIVSEEIERINRLNVSNGAALVTNPSTGEILAMVGSINYFDFENDGQVNVTLRPRQPGSSIKPLTYALALESGKNPATYIDDAPITYTSQGSPPYSPKNYDGKYHGSVTLREALASSYNIPAVKLLAEIGVSTLLSRAPDFGITTWDDPRRFGLSLTLGGGEVLMTEMAELYGTFANGGEHIRLNPIIEVRTYDGTVLYKNVCVLENKCQSNEALSPEVAYQVTNILADNRARTPAFGPQSTLTIPGQEVAVKTGTTNNLRDNWTIGYTSNSLVAVWVGNNDNTSMSYVASGITGASPIWNSIMRTQLSEESPHTFPIPNAVTFADVCTRMSDGSRTYQEVFLSGAVVRSTCAPSPLKLPTIQNNTPELFDGVTIQTPIRRTRL